MRAKLLCASVVAGVLIFAALAARPADAQQSTAFQIQPSHVGSTTFPQGFKLPLTIAWSRKWPVPYGYNNDVSYPIIANGKVFVTVTPFGTGLTGTFVYALSLQNGQVLWRKYFAANTHWSALAYDNGRLFAVTGTGLVVALDPDTGAEFWRSSITDIRTYYFKSAPTAYNGRLFVKGAGLNATLFALDQSTGKIIWKQRVDGGGFGSPTVAGNAVYVSHGDHVYKFDAESGVIRWYYNGKITAGGPGQTAPFYSGRIYANEVKPFKMYSLDARTAAPINSFDRIWKPPAFYNGIGYFVTYSHGLVAWTTSGKNFLWRRFAGSEPGLPPIVVNGNVLAVSHGAVLYVLDGKSGQTLQELALGSHVTPNGEIVGMMQKGMGAGEGMVVVATDDMVFALKQASE